MGLSSIQTNAVRKQNNKGKIKVYKSVLNLEFVYSSNNWCNSRSVYPLLQNPRRHESFKSIITPHKQVRTYATVEDMHLYVGLRNDVRDCHFCKLIYNGTFGTHTENTKQIMIIITKPYGT
jgi:hypothetical protein